MAGITVSSKSRSSMKRKNGSEDLDGKRVKGNEVSHAFLDTIDKKKLDFDHEKACSLTLSRLNVYCCLVCGKYLHGRQPNTPAFLHSVNEGHHIYVNFSTLKFYLLPGGDELIDNGEIQLLNLLRYAIRPTFTKREIAQFPKKCVDLNNNHYSNGFVGINADSKFKALNAVILAISHISPIRDYLLLSDFGKESDFLRRLGLIVRKLWSVKLFKPQVSAEEFVSFVLVNDKKSAEIMKDPRKCLLWLLDCMAKSSPSLRDLTYSHCRGEVIISKTKVETIYDEAHNVKEFVREKLATESTSPFWMLTLELPPRPLFKSGLNVNDLPQVRLEDLMAKFDGQKEKQMSHHILRYKIKRFPTYLVLHFDRFDKKAQRPVKDRNQAIVEFPLIMEIDGRQYTLLGNIVHCGVKPSTESDKDEESQWIIQLRNEQDDEWFEFDGTNLRKREKELLFLSETFIQIWKQTAS